MCEKLTDRQRRMAEAYKEGGKKKATASDEALFKQAGIKVKKV